MIGMYKHLFILFSTCLLVTQLSAQNSKRKRIPMEPGSDLVFGSAVSPTPKGRVTPPPTQPPTPQGTQPATSAPAQDSPVPGYVPTAQQPFQTAPRPSLTPLEIQASIYAVAGLPEVATMGTFTVPALGTVNVVDAMLFLQTGSPVEINAQIMPAGGAKPFTVSYTFTSGFGTLPIPAEHAGRVATFKANRPVCFYVPKPPDGVMFGIDISRLLRQIVAPKTSDRRVQVLSRPNLRLDLMPSDPQAISECPDTKDYWETFLKRVSTLQ